MSKQLTHDYAQPGTYSIKVTDAKGRTGTAEFKARTNSITALEPATESITAADFNGHVRGTGFTEDSVIVWNGADEPTRFVDQSDVWTIVKPSVVSSPTTVTVQVRNADGSLTDPLTFTWTA